MKILYYNWVDYLDDEARGGGVSIYQKNLLAEMHDDPSIETTFLCSGISYDLFANEPRWEQIKHGRNDNRTKRYEIINSGVLSPSHHSFGNPAQIKHTPTTEAFFDFIEQRGPFDIIHFNNLEGLPATVLELKTRWPETRIVLSLHNYYPVCPQVNLWHQERENCVDFKDGRNCEHCLPHRADEKVIRLANAVAFNLKKWGIRPGSRVFDRLFMPTMRIAKRLIRLTKPAAQRKRKPRLLTRLRPTFDVFRTHRLEMVRLINDNCDRVLCVSDRVGAVAEKFGVNPGLLRTSYIGTSHARKFAETQPRPALLGPDGSLTLGYLGYMRMDKGFYFLLDALEGLPKETAQKINLVICARKTDERTMDRLLKISEKYKSISYANGYSHDQLDALLQDVDVGLIPVLWEDNLPQVAIEMHARHIPLLTSDLGGAQELGRARTMVFKAGSIKSFHIRINNLLAGKIKPGPYWRGAMTPVSMAEHVQDLRNIYHDILKKQDTPAEQGS
jgi:glycosyltransferase involved in cell wall biosynthesis